MTTLPSMGLVLPTRGAAGAGAWDDTIDADLGLVDAHDHTPGKGEMIPVAALSIDDDVSFSGAYAPINLHRLTFASVTALSTNNKSLFVSSSDNELYWRSNAGANVKITNGAALNVAAFTGGFGAGYSSAGAVADYDSSTTRYTFKTNTGTWARGAFGGVRLYEHGTSAATYVALLSPASLASTYSVTFPAALPASTAVVQMSSAGVLTADVAPTISGLITASEGITCSANKDVTVSGTGAYNHGNFRLRVHATNFVSPSAIGWTNGIASLPNSAVATSGIPLLIGDRITSIVFSIRDSVATTGTVRISSTNTDGTVTIPAAGTASVNTAGTGVTQLITITPSSPLEFTDTLSFVAEVTTGGGGGTFFVRSFDVYYDHP